MALEGACRCLSACLFPRKMSDGDQMLREGPQGPNLAAPHQAGQPHSPWKEDLLQPGAREEKPPSSSCASGPAPVSREKGGRPWLDFGIRAQGADLQWCHRAPVGTKGAFECQPEGPILSGFPVPM